MKIERPIYIQQLIDSKDNGLIKVITGLRRVGKSYLLKTLFKDYLLEEKVSIDHILIIDLEDRKQNVFCGRWALSCFHIQRIFLNNPQP